MSYKGSKCIDCGAEITTDGAGHRPVDKGYVWPIFEGPLCPVCWERDCEKRYQRSNTSARNEE